MHIKSDFYKIAAYPALFYIDTLRHGTYPAKSYKLPQNEPVASYICLY